MVQPDLYASGIVGFLRQFLDFPHADVACFGLAVDGQQGNHIINLGVINDAEAAALATPSGAVGQAHFVDLVADARDALAGRSSFDNREIRCRTSFVTDGYLRPNDLVLLRNLGKMSTCVGILFQFTVNFIQDF